MADAVVGRLHAEMAQLRAYFEVNGETSFQVTINEVFTKCLLLASASFFERVIIDSIGKMAADKAGAGSLTEAFVRLKGLSRQYHNLFQWEQKNANSFFGLFGDQFKKAMAKKVEADDALDEAVRAFLEIGAERNRLVHGDFGTYTLEKTADEIYDSFKKGMRFVEFLQGEFASWAPSS